MFSVHDQNMKSVFNIGMHLFTRAGAWFGIQARPRRFTSPASVGEWGSTAIHVATRRGSHVELESDLMMELIPMYEGEQIPFAVHASPTEMRLRTEYGDIRICMPDPALMLVQGENGLSLMLSKDMGMHEFIRRRSEKAWEANYRYVCSLVFNPVHGEIDMKADWDFENLCTPEVRGLVLPDENGEFELAIEECTHLGHIREEYPEYYIGLRHVQREWESFVSKQPLLGDFTEERVEAAYITWSMIVGASGLMKRPHIMMSGATIASAWQMCENAIVLRNHPELAIDLLLNHLDMQGPTGQLPDFFDDSRGNYQCIKPPIQGWALQILMQQYNFKEEVPEEKLRYMYEGYSKWANWFTTCRDDDQDGIPQYEHGDESGNDDCPLFRIHYKLDLPDLSAMLVLLYEKLGDLADILELPEEAEAWREKSKKLLSDLIRVFWNGERFVGRVTNTHEPVDMDSIMFYRVLILGKRLPREIIDKMAADLELGNGYLTPSGLVSQKVTSPEYSRLSYACGGITPSDNILVITGLYMAGKTELAKEAARCYMNGCVRPESPYYPAGYRFNGSWPAAAFQILGDICFNLE